MKIVTTEANQTIYDIAVQHYGTVEAVSELLVNNVELINDPAALAQQGIDYVADKGFYVDIPLAVGTTIKVDTQSPNYKQNITRDINKHITTYGTDN